MIVFKCKMCGGEMELEEGATVAECPYCMTKQTLPKLDNDKRANMYDRANHFRRQNEYDKAMAIFESVLQEDRTDAEAYWSLVLCRYGIEYVEDPATHKRVPTVNRVQYTSILADEDYKSALEYADFAQRSVYEEEAKAIDEIQKGILAISKQEKPFDVFICYKETDANGRRTPDSVLANDLYHQLTNEGFKVFFSRITLEDKIGTAYEPYIFAALNSAKVMVVLGTKPEYFKAVWVKNEWSRYLALIRAGADKTLVPAYRDMDPYDLPDEFSHLQAQDMSKLGFMQDLIRCIKKLTEQKSSNIQTVAQQTSSGANIESLLKRARLFMEDGDFKNASEYLDRVLDIDPECSSAYAAKVCVTFGIRKEADLAETTFQYEDNPDWQKAIRFADAQQKAVYEGYATKVQERVTRQIRDYAYDCAMEMAVLPGADRGKLDAELTSYKASCTRSTGKHADGSRRADSRMKENAFSQVVKSNEPGDVSEAGLKTAAAMFTTIGDSEATERARQCKVLAEQARQKAIYLNADGMRSREQRHPSGLEEAARLFLTVPDYKDAKAKAQACVDAAEVIRSGLYDSAVSAMNAAGGESSKWDTAKKKLAETELNGYRDVAQLRAKAAKRYDECVAAEQEAKRQAEERQRREAEAAAAKKKRNTVLGILAAVVVVAAVLVVTLVIIPGNNYRNAVALQQAGRYEEAITAFEALNGYGDSTTQITETKYLKAKSLADKGDYAGAAAIFIGIKGYKDVDSLLVNDHNLSAAAAAAAAAAARDAKYSVGNYVTFGHYPQTSGGNDSTPIEWLVLARDGNRALLISRYTLDAKPYNTSYTDITWEKCTLRTWLNGNFLNAAFSTNEQRGILTTTVDNSKEQGYSGYNTNGGNNTQDKLFLLSYSEAWNYFKSDNARISTPTKYAKSQEGNGYSDRWWLRSPGYTQFYAAYVYSDGARNFDRVSNTRGVRPALWINLESDIF